MARRIFLALFLLTGTFAGSAVRAAVVNFSLSGTGVPLSVTIAGIGSATFAGRIRLVSNRNPGRVGLGDETSGRAILFANVANASYDLTTSFGPLTGPSPFNPSTFFGTEGGDFQITSMGGSTYAATVGGTVPEPASWALLIIGFVSSAMPRLAARDSSP